MTNPDPFNLPQSVFMISLGSNALFGEINFLPGDLQAKLRAFLSGSDPGVGQGPFFQALNLPGQAWPSLAANSANGAGDWRTVWGPVVYQGPLNPGATNAMYVAHSPNLQTYVVAIAGTNPTGDYALFVEDLAVAPANMVQWPPAVSSATPPSLNWTGVPQAGSSNGAMQPIQQMPDPSSPYIDAGTSDGLTILYTMLDKDRPWLIPGQAAPSPMTLSQFLGSVSQENQTLVFTGHSLGGALAPTLAMLLYPKAAKSPGPTNSGDPSLKSNWANVFVLATAGPTPGTQGFANLFFTPAAAPVIGALDPILTVNPPLPPPAATGSYAPVATGAPQSAATWQFSYWNVIYANTYDVVPRAWNALANLVQQPNTGSGGNYPSFFGGGLTLSPVKYPLDLVAPGPDAYKLVTHVMGTSGYNGDATNYYVPCLLHVPFNGVFGNWTSSSTYPPAPWTPAAPTGPVSSLGDLKSVILNAHLGQYPSAFLGYPCPTIENVPPLPSS